MTEGTGLGTNSLLKDTAPDPDGSGVTFNQQDTIDQMANADAYFDAGTELANAGDSTSLVLASEDFYLGRNVVTSVTSEIECQGNALEDCAKTIPKQ
ncbi:MAG: hypothetical protein AAF968_06800 [Pseudomonadota bacterium]